MKRLLFVALVLLLFLTACAPQAVPTPMPKPIPTPTPTPTPVAVAPTPTPAPWGEWDKVVEAARREGKVNVYTATLYPTARIALYEAFKKEYGIIVHFVAGAPPLIAEKIAVEQRAKAYVADVWETGAKTMVDVAKPQGLLGEPIKLPSALLERASWRADPFSLDPEGIIFTYSQTVGAGPVININLVKPQEEPKSWLDFLEPRWKGKIILDDPSFPGPGSHWMTMIKEYLGGMETVRKFASQDPLISRDRREQVELVFRGDYPAVLTGVYGFAIPALEKGAPIKILKMKEINMGSTYSIALVKNAPNPNAAKVFTNWFLSREGQTIWTQGMKLASTRTDVTQEHLHPQVRWAPEEKAVVATPQFMVAWDESMKQAPEVFKIRR